MSLKEPQSPTPPHSEAALSALRFLVQMGKKRGENPLTFIHVAAARRTENIFIWQAQLASAHFDGPWSQKTGL